MISANLLAVFYLISGVLFILALRGLSSPETSRQGNLFDTANIFGFLAIILAAINIFGGFLVTQRMLQMYKKKKDKKK